VQKVSPQHDQTLTAWDEQGELSGIEVRGKNFQ
jgi:hypothetical protein